MSFAVAVECPSPLQLFVLRRRSCLFFVVILERSEGSLYFASASALLLSLHLQLFLLPRTTKIVISTEVAQFHRATQWRDPRICLCAGIPTLL
jgi:hypothetical protein